MGAPGTPGYMTKPLVEECTKRELRPANSGRDLGTGLAVVYALRGRAAFDLALHHTFADGHASTAEALLKRCGAAIYPYQDWRFGKFRGNLRVACPSSVIRSPRWQRRRQGQFVDHVVPRRRRALNAGEAKRVRKQAAAGHRRCYRTGKRDDGWRWWWTAVMAAESAAKPTAAAPSAPTASSSFTKTEAPSAASAHTRGVGQGGRVIRDVVEEIERLRDWSRRPARCRDSASGPGCANRPETW